MVAARVGARVRTRSHLTGVCLGWGVKDADIAVHAAGGHVPGRGLGFLGGLA